ncbi:ABC transporter permease [Persicimonas caeni]|uniref:Transport permease protein n=2 Tax=Persicimonas caeni TaxID=2292766 RepID=A0A4Y6Q4H4_PERCE|nr:ABC transporter permease [Persicimonas caeni]QED36107.1 ABC transporter permease [Persicimonas caeni]
MPVQTVIEARSGWRLIDWRELVRYKDLLTFLVLRDVRVIYKQTVLGIGWAIIRPLFSMIVFSVVFGKMAKVPSDGIPYPIFSYAALVPWTYFATAMTASTESLVKDRRMITKVYFPRLVVPLAPVLAKLMDFAIAFLLLIALMLGYGYAPTWKILFLPILVVMMVATATGAGLWLSALAIQYRDVKYVAQFLVQLLMYAAPVVWPASLVPDQYRLLYGLYPMAGVIEGMRASLLGTGAMPWELIGMGAISTTVIVISGAFYFRRVERVFADVA